MQRARDWRRKQTYLHKHGFGFRETFRHSERVDGYQEVDYNRTKFKSNSERLIEEQLTT